VVIAMLPASLSAFDQGCLNVPAEPATASSAARPAVQAAAFYAQDLPGMLASGFRAERAAAHWALLGDSSGGYCALQLALSNSWVFSVAAVPDGAYSQPPGASENAASPQFKQQQDLLWLLRSQPMQRISVLFTGSGPGSGGGQAAPWLSLARRPMRVAQTALGSGSWPLDGVLTWIGHAIGRDAPFAGHRSRADRGSHAVAG
jgi:Putative esterase